MVLLQAALSKEQSLQEPPELPPKSPALPWPTLSMRPKLTLSMKISNNTVYLVLRVWNIIAILFQILTGKAFLGFLQPIKALCLQRKSFLAPHVRLSLIRCHLAQVLGLGLVLGLVLFLLLLDVNQCGKESFRSWIHTFTTNCIHMNEDR